MVAPAIIGALVGAGLGAAKYKQDQQQEARDRQLSAALMRQSPWTGMRPTTNFEHHSLLGNVSQGALGGASFGLQDAFKPKEGETAATQTETPPPTQPAMDLTQSQPQPYDYQPGQGPVKPSGVVQPRQPRSLSAWPMMPLQQS